jgi:excisionase family DNA binding protein
MNRFFSRQQLFDAYRLPKHVLEHLLIQVAPVEKDDRGEALFLEAHVDAWLTARYEPLRGQQADGSSLVPDLPREVSTEEAAVILGVSKDTVLKLRSSGLLPFRNAAPPGSTRPAYRFPLEAVVRLRTTYDTEEPTPNFPKERPRRAGKRRLYKHIDYD